MVTDVKDVEKVIRLIQECLEKPEEVHLIYVNRHGDVDKCSLALSKEGAKDEFFCLSDVAVLGPFFEICTVNVGGNGLVQGAVDPLDPNDRKTIQDALENALDERQHFYVEREKVYGSSAWPFGANEGAERSVTSTTTTAKKKTSKSGLTRKINNAFRKECIKFEQSQLFDKIEAMSEEQLDAVVIDLQEIEDHFDSRIWEAEDEIREECNEMLQAATQKHGWALVKDFIEDRYHGCSTFNAEYDPNGAIDDMQPLAEVAEDPRFMTIPDLKTKYTAVWESFVSPAVCKICSRQLVDGNCEFINHKQSMEATANVQSPNLSS